MSSRCLGNRVVVVFCGSEIHAGTLEVVSRAHRVLPQYGTGLGSGLLAQSGERCGPSSWVAVLDLTSGRKQLANGRTHVVRCPQAPEQLKVHLWISEPVYPSCRT